MTVNEQEQFTRLLQDAGRHEPPAGVSHSKLIEKVYARSLRKRQARRIAVRSFTILCLLVVGGWVWHSQTKNLPEINQQIVESEQTVSPAPEVKSNSRADLRAEIARLEKEIEWTLQIAQQALRLQKANTKLLHQQRRQKTPVYSLEMARADIEKTAFLLVDRGDSLGRRPNGRQAQIDSYRQAVEMFSETSWGQTAQQRLANLENNN